MRIKKILLGVLATSLLFSAKAANAAKSEPGYEPIYPAGVREVQLKIKGDTAPFGSWYFNLADEKQKQYEATTGRQIEQISGYKGPLSLSLPKYIKDSGVKPVAVESVDEKKSSPIINSSSFPDSKISYKKGMLYNFDAKNLELREFFSRVSLASRVEIKVDEKLKGTAPSVFLNNVSVENILNGICYNMNLKYSKDSENVYSISNAYN